MPTDKPAKSHNTWVRSREVRTPLNRELILDLAIPGKTWKEIQAETGIHETTIHRWMGDDPTFLQEYGGARGIWIEIMLDEVEELATEALTVRTDSKGKPLPSEVGKADRILVAIRAIEISLAKRFPKRFGALMKSEFKANRNSSPTVTVTTRG